MTCSTGGAPYFVLSPAVCASDTRVTSSRADLAEPFTALMSSVYRRVEGQARLSLYQQTSTSV